MTVPPEDIEALRTMVAALPHPPSLAGLNEVDRWAVADQYLGLVEGLLREIWQVTKKMRRLLPNDDRLPALDELHEDLRARVIEAQRVEQAARAAYERVFGPGGTRPAVDDA